MIQMMKKKDIIPSLLINHFYKLAILS